MGTVGKKFVNAKQVIGGKGDLSLDEAVVLIKENAFAKFDETIDIAINLGVDPKHADQMVRGVCSLPHGNGKNVPLKLFEMFLELKVLFLLISELYFLDALIISNLRFVNILLRR